MDKKTIKMSSLSIVSLVLAFVFIPFPGRPSAWQYLKQKSVDTHIRTFEDPVFLPSGAFRADSTYATYIGWNNAYVIRYVDEQKNLEAELIQFNSNSTLFSIAGEGPSNDELSVIRNFALTQTGCKDFDKPNEVLYCTNDEYGYLIRSVTHEGTDFYLASSVFSEETESKTTNKFGPQTNSISHRIIKSATPLDPELASDYIYIDI